jgi:hypothetical protein
MKANTQLSYRSYKDSLPFVSPSAVLPRNFYNQHLGYFCKKESMLQSKTGINIFLRLGSKNYVDFLEKKPNSLNPL